VEDRVVERDHHEADAEHGQRQPAAPVRDLRILQLRSHASPWVTVSGYGEARHPPRRIDSRGINVHRPSTPCAKLLLMTVGRESAAGGVLAGCDLSGQWVLVTGASAGIGQETARAVAARGANVVMAVRDVEKGECAAEPVRAAAADHGATVELRAVDLASL